MTDRSARFGMAVPQVVRGALDLSELRDVVLASEEYGFDSLWVMENGVGLGRAAESLEPLSLLSYAAALTARVRLGTSVLRSGLREPSQLAAELATLDQLSHGRLIVGIGRGGSDWAARLGLSPSEWTARFEEGVEALLALWREGPTSFDGRFWKLQDVVVMPKPVQRPSPPLWFGARGRPALERAVRLGSGWMGAGSSTKQDFVSQVSALSELLERQGGKRFEISKRVYLAVNEGREDLLPRIEDFFTVVYGAPDKAAGCAVWGPAEVCAERLQSLIDAGAELLVLNPMFDLGRQFALIVERVLPLLHDGSRQIGPS